MALAAGTIGIGLAALNAPSADAATFTVTNLNDSGAGTLRQAIVDANALAGADVIAFQPALTGTITLTSGQLSISDSVNIQGPGEALLSVSGNNSSRVFYLYNSSGLIDVSISRLTITNGAASSGAGIVDYDENLTLDHVTLKNNAASSSGGGLWMDGFTFSATITNSTISGNTAGSKGGGIYVEDTGGPLLFQNSVITNNSAPRGGGVYFYDPDHEITFDRDTISNNTATAGAGGGIFLYDTDGGPFVISHSTISGNSATAGGGLFFYGPDDAVEIDDSTISGNHATAGDGGGVLLYSAYAGFNFQFSTVVSNDATGSGGGFFANNGTVDIRNSILANNTAGGDGPDEASPGAVTTLTYSLVEAPYSFADGGHNIIGTDPELGPLANNGGPTLTHAPLANSVVIDAGSQAASPDTTDDQRGNPRVVGAASDMGAVEVNGGTIAFAQATYTVAENAGSVTVTLTRTGGSDPATIEYATDDGTATAGSDYGDMTGTVSFGAGELSKTIIIPILDDALVEGPETFLILLAPPSRGATLGAQNTTTVTITDVEAGTFQLSSATYSVAENGGNATVTVNRLNGSDGTATVNYATSNGTATAGADYTASAGTLSFATGETSKTITIPIIDDAIAEGSETFNVSLTAPTGGATLTAPTAATVTITDFEPGVLQLGSTTYAVAENGGSVTVTVNRANGSDGAASVNYATSNGTATAGADYTAMSGTLNFAVGETSKSIVIPILDDSIVEGNEAFNVTLSAPTGATLGAPSAATVTISDFESGMLQLSSATYAVAENGGSVTLTVNRANGSDGAASVNYATSNGTATAGADYTAMSGTLNFAVGETSKSIVIPILDDTVVEGNEAFNVTLSAPTGATLGAPSAATVTITDFESGMLQLSSATYTVAENGGSVTLTVNRANGSDGAASVNYATSNGTATAGADYTAMSGTLNFAAGETSKSIVIPILDDTVVEGNEAFNVTLSAPTGATLAAPSAATVTITDFESGTLQLSSATYTVAENGGSVTLTVNRANGSDGAASVNYATSNGTATAGTDYTAMSGTLNFAAGETSKSIVIPILDDTIVEGNEAFNVTLSAPTGATLAAPSAATVTITDFESGTLQLSSATYTVAENGGSVTLTVNRANGSDGAASVNYATSNGTATAGADYTTMTGTLNFAAGETSKSVVIPILDDSIVEGSEAFNVTLSAPTGATLAAPSTAAITITDVEPGAFQLGNSTYSVNETGGLLAVTVNRTNGTTGAVSVNYATSNGTATAGSDYTATSGTINFADGDSTPKTFNVPILSDIATEGNETFNITLSAPTAGAVLGTPVTAIATIVDIVPAGHVTFSAPNVFVVEGSGSVTLTVVRDDATAAQSVTYATSNGSATAGADYTATSGTITFNPGETQKSIIIPIINDTVPEPDETFTVTLSGAGVVSPAFATVTISNATGAPTLDTWAKLLAILSSALVGFFALGRKRMFGFFFALLFLGITAGTLSAAAITPVAPHASGGAAAHAKQLHDAESKQDKVRGVVASVATTKEGVVLTLQGGATALLAPNVSAVHDFRSPRGAEVSASAIQAGQQVVIKTRRNKSGAVKKIVVKIVK